MPTSTRVVLTVQSFAWTTTGAARQKALLGSSTARSNLATQIAAAVRDRGADGVNLDFEPIASGYADEFTALVRTVRARSNTVHGLPADLRHDGLDRQLPDRGRHGARRRRRHLHHGLRLPIVGSSPVGSIAPIGGARYDIRDPVGAMSRAFRPPSSSSACPTTGAPGRRRRAISREEHLGQQVRRVDDRAVRDGPFDYAATYGRAYDPIEGVAWTAYRRDTCTATYGCVTAWREIYYDDATALRAEYDLVNRYGLRGAGIWALGYDGTRPELYQAIADKFIIDTVPPSISSWSLSPGAFSPNGDGVLDSTTARLRVTGLITWGYRVQPVVGGTLGANIRSGTRTGKAPILTWTGRIRTGQRVPDGRYRITLWAEDASGNRAAAGVQRHARHEAGERHVERLDGFITPDGDGRPTPCRCIGRPARPWPARCGCDTPPARPSGRWTFGLRTSWSTTWNGRDRQGLVVKDGRYTFRVDGRDRAGNRTVVDRTILVDRTIRSVALDRQVVRSASRATEPRRRRPAPRGEGHRRRSITATRWSGGSGPPAPWRPGRTAGPGTVEARPAPTSCPGRTGSS